jgi:hypothetical protein
MVFLEFVLMPLTVGYQTLILAGTLFAFTEDQISFGEAENKTVVRNVGGKLINLIVRRPSVQLTIDRTNNAIAQALYAQWDEDKRKIVNATGAVQGEDYVIGPRTIRNALIANVTNQGPFYIDGNSLVQVQVTLESQEWE